MMFKKRLVRNEDEGVEERGIYAASTSIAICVLKQAEARAPKATIRAQPTSDRAQD
jgi:hypothetical protein